MSAFKYPFTPSKNSLCLCGSGKKFKRCCIDRYASRPPNTRTRPALKSGNYKLALEECRADITQYTIWHKSHTEPAIAAGIPEPDTLLETDIAAMGEFVDLLFHCYTKNDIVDEFPATLERLRSNINDPRWQRKIVYFQAICALWPDWNIASGLRELKKLGSLRDESDVETLQLYVCLSGNRLSFSEKQYYVDKIIQLADSAVDRLHYRGFKAVELLF